MHYWLTLGLIDLGVGLIVFLTSESRDSSGLRGKMITGLGGFFFSPCILVHLLECAAGIHADAGR